MEYSFLITVPLICYSNINLLNLVSYKLRNDSNNEIVNLFNHFLDYILTMCKQRCAENGKHVLNITYHIRNTLLRPTLGKLIICHLRFCVRVESQLEKIMPGSRSRGTAARACILPSLYYKGGSVVIKTTVQRTVPGAGHFFCPTPGHT